MLGCDVEWCEVKAARALNVGHTVVICGRNDGGCDVLMVCDEGVWMLAVVWCGRLWW